MPHGRLPGREKGAREAGRRERAAQAPRPLPPLRRALGPLPLLSIPPTEPSAALQWLGRAGAPHGTPEARSGWGWSSCARPPVFPGWGTLRKAGVGGGCGAEVAVGLGAGAVNGARCRRPRGEGTRCRVASGTPRAAFPG